jgi:hypothetical protein
VCCARRSRNNGENMNEEEFQSDFEYRKLYTQTCLTEEDLSVTNAVFAIRWTYPGATNHTTGRVRITCMYFDEYGSIAPVSGAIERLSDRGWLFIDEFCNDSISFNNADEFVEHMMLLAHSFIMGVPVDVITGDVKPKPRKPSSPGTKKKEIPDKKPTKLKVLKFEKPSGEANSYKAVLKEKDNKDKKIKPKKKPPVKKDPGDDDDNSSPN